MNKTTEKIPTWSLGYIINGDMTGLTDEEIRMIDEWLSKWKVEDCDILYTNDNI